MQIRAGKMATEVDTMDAAGLEQFVLEQASKMKAGKGTDFGDQLTLIKKLTEQMKTDIKTSHQEDLDTIKGVLAEYYDQCTRTFKREWSTVGEYEAKRSENFPPNVQCRKDQINQTKTS